LGEVERAIAAVLQLIDHRVPVRRPAAQSGEHERVELSPEHVRLHAASIPSVARYQRSFLQTWSLGPTSWSDTALNTSCWTASYLPRPGPTHWTSGVTPGPITVTRSRSPGAGPRVSVDG